MEQVIDKVMDETESLIYYQSEANRLAEHYQIKRPTVKFTCSRGGYYSPHLQLVKLPRKKIPNPKALRDSFLHEFAHHLNTARRGRMHDAGFKRSMWSVATYYYGDPLAYNWRQDYPNVKKYFERRVKDTKGTN